MSACIEGHIQQDILNHNEEGAKRTLDRLVSLSARMTFTWKSRITGFPRKSRPHGIQALVPGVRSEAGGDQ